MRRSPKSHRSYGKYQSQLNSQLKDIANNLTDYINAIESNAGEGIKEVAQEIFDKSLEIVPIDTGELKDSAYIKEGTINGNYVVEVGYTAEHAVFAHENPWTHEDYMNPTTPGTHYQFLLTPASEVENDIAKRVADKIKGSLK